MDSQSRFEREIVRVRILHLLPRAVRLMDKIGVYETLDIGSIPIPPTRGICVVKWFVTLKQ